MLGETFELVTDRLRFVAEKVRQHPHVIETFHMETDDYWVNTYNKMTKPVFHFDWGRGYIEVELMGAKSKIAIRKLEMDNKHTESNKSWKRSF